MHCFWERPPPHLLTVIFNRPLTFWPNRVIIKGTADGGTVVKVLRYKSEGRWFNSRWCNWNFSLT
jgi:hypothetical protein